MSLQDHQWILRSTGVRIFSWSHFSVGGNSRFYSWNNRSDNNELLRDERRSCVHRLKFMFNCCSHHHHLKLKWFHVKRKTLHWNFEALIMMTTVMMMSIWWRRRWWWKRIDSFVLSRNHSFCQSDDEEEEDAKEQVVSWSTLIILSCCFSLAFSFLFTFGLFSALFSSDCRQSLLFGCMTITSLTPYEL